MRTIRRRATVALGAAGLIVAGAGGIAARRRPTPTEPATGDAGRARSTTMWTPNPDLLAGAEGEVNSSPGPATSRTARPIRPSTGSRRSRTSPGAPSTSSSATRQRRDGAADAERRVRRRVGVGRRHRPADRRRRGRPARRQPSSPATTQIFDDLKLQQWNSVDGEPYGMPHGRGANLLVYNTEAFADAAAGLVGRDVRGRHAGRRRGLGVRQPDLHRRRRGVPDGAPSPTSASPTRTPSTRPVRRRRSPCSSSRRRSSASTGRSTPTSRPRSRAAPCSPARRGR